MTNDDVIRLLWQHVHKYGQQAILAKKIGITPAYLHDVLNGRREPAGKILEYLELKRVVTYEKSK